MDVRDVGRKVSTVTVWGTPESYRVNVIDPDLVCDRELKRIEDSRRSERAQAKALLQRGPILRPELETSD